eukprot:gene26573-18339_t
MSYPSTLGKMELRIGIHVGPMYAGVLGVVSSMSYPSSLGKMELRIGIHVGPVYAGVLGFKYRHATLLASLATTQKLAWPSRLFFVRALTIHISDMVIQTLIGLPHPMRQGGPSYNNIYSSVSGYSNSALNPESSGPMSQKSALIPQHFGLMAQNSRQMPQHFGLMAQKSGSPGTAKWRDNSAQCLRQKLWANAPKSCPPIRKQGWLAGMW